jgi:antitoxin ParD1/3/4/toxin ParE1/3/4
MTDAFQLIARNPNIGHVRGDLAGERKLLFWPVRDYLIVYRPSRKPLAVAMIVHGKRDVAALIEARL